MALQVNRGHRTAYLYGESRIMNKEPKVNIAMILLLDTAYTYLQICGMNFDMIGLE